MKIIEIIPELCSGGAERFVVDLCNELCRQNEVILVVLHSLDKYGFYKDEVSSRVRILSLNKKMGFDVSTVFKLHRIISKECPDVVHTHLAAIEYAFISAIINKKVRFYHTVHNDAEKESSGGIKRVVRKIVFKRHIVIPVTISPASDRSFSSFYGISATMIVNGRNVPSALEPSNEMKQEFVNYRKSGRVMVQLARFEPQKRHLLMARVINRLANEGFHFSMLMIGDQRDGMIAKQVKDIGCSCIHLLGQKSNPLEYLKLADAFCLSSEYEGMPISLIEALGMGTIPVCTPVGGIVDTIKDGVNGFLSDDVSELSYYKAMKRFLLLSDEALSDMRQRVLDSYTPYSMVECAQKYLTLFEFNAKM